MAVRVRVRIQGARGKQRAQVETVAVANTGFESDGPEVLLPAVVAERLRLWPNPVGARLVRGESAFATVAMMTVPDAVLVSLAHGDRGRRAVAPRCGIVISEHESEVILNDHLVEALGIELVAPGRGLYRVGRRGRLRPSDPPEHW